MVRLGSPTRCALTAFLALALASASSALAQGSSLRDGIDQLAQQLSQNLSTARILRVAISDFADLRGTTTDLGRYVAERLTTRLAAATDRFAVTERRRLQQVVAELSLSQSDLVDPRHARRVGEMLGVDGIVVGTVSPLGDRVEIDARVVEIDVNNVVTQGSVSVIRDQTVDALLSGTTTPPSAPVAPPSGPTQPPPASSAPEFIHAAIRVQALSAALRRGELVLAVLVTNRLSQDWSPAVLGDNRFYVTDNEGRSIDCRFSSGGHLIGGRMEILPGVPTRMELGCTGLSPRARSVTLIWDPMVYRSDVPQRVVLQDIVLEH